MPIKVSINEAPKRRGLKGKDLARRVGISETQLSMFLAGKIKGVRFSTLSRICAVLECPLSDVITYEFSREDLELPAPVDQDDQSAIGERDRGRLPGQAATFALGVQRSFRFNPKSRRRAWRKCPETGGPPISALSAEQPCPAGTADDGKRVPHAVSWGH